MAPLLELTESLHRAGLSGGGALPHLRSKLLRVFSSHLQNKNVKNTANILVLLQRKVFSCTHQGKFLWSPHLPDDDRGWRTDVGGGGGGGGVPRLAVHPAAHIAGLHCQHHGVHQVLGCLDQRHRAVQTCPALSQSELITIIFCLSPDTTSSPDTLWTSALTLLVMVSWWQ